MNKRIEEIENGINSFTKELYNLLQNHTAV